MTNTAPIYGKTPAGSFAPMLSVAPMMDWTDRHCRFFHRQITQRTLLYTEMVVADAAIHGDRQRLLGFDPVEHPLALQLGGSDPVKLVHAARIGEDFGYDEINLNVGCPSDRVQSGTFGACLMRTPELVADCVGAMGQAVSIPVTVKCRIGVDEQDPELALDALAEHVFAAGVNVLWVHARKAWLEGLSPKENRDIPPLDYGRVYRLKQKHPDKFIGINGGIPGLGAAREHLTHVDGVMLGRAAYHTPECLTDADAAIYGGAPRELDYQALCEVMCDYAASHIARGGRLGQVTRHMLGLFHGRAGSRRYRQMLSADAYRPGAGPDVLRAAFASVLDQPAQAAE